MKSSISIAALLFIALPQSHAVPSSVTLQPTDGKTEFVAIGRPAMLKIHGEEKGPEGTAQIDGDKVSGNFRLPLEALSTGIAMRDEHMKKKYLEVEKYPTAELTLAPTAIVTSGEVPFNGELTLHGVKHAINGSALIRKTDKGFKVESKFKVALSDYKIDVPTYAGIKVADEVEVNTQFEVKAP